LERLQFFAGLEANCFTGWDGYFGAGARIAANPGFPRLYVKDAKAAQLDPVAAFQRLLHFIEDALDRHLRFGLSDSGLVHHFVDDVEFDQNASSMSVKLSS